MGATHDDRRRIRQVMFVESALQTADLQPIDAGEFPIVMSFPDADIACKAFLAGGGSARAISTVEKSASGGRCATSWKDSE